MKKIILLALAALMMVGCVKDGKVDRSNFVTVEMDSCEYIKWGASYGYQHKGNCRFCKERRQKELKELVEQLKEK
jgi:hypothetical protein